MENAETRIEREVAQQNTGNHERSGMGGSDRYGGTRAGADHVEPKANPTHDGTDAARTTSLEERLDEEISVNGPAERAPERDENGRL